MVCSSIGKEIRRQYHTASILRHRLEEFPEECKCPLPNWAEREPKAVLLIESTIEVPQPLEYISVNMVIDMDGVNPN